MEARKAAKARSNAPPANLYALGQGTSGATSVPASSVHAQRTLPHTAVLASRKRDLTPAQSGPIIAKKHRVDGEAAAVTPTSDAEGVVAQRLITKDDVWRKHATVSPLVSCRALMMIFPEGEENNTPAENAVNVICSMIARLHEHRTKVPEPIIFTSLAVIARRAPQLMMLRQIVEGLCSLLKRAVVKPGMKASGWAGAVVANCLALVYRNEKVWPELFVKVYLDDALSERCWVDRADCAEFVLNVCTAFGVNKAPIQRLRSHKKHAEQQPAAATESELLQPDPERVYPRFAQFEADIKNYTLELLKEHWARRSDAVNRSLLLTMVVCTPYAAVRQAGAKRIEGWLQNPKLQKYAVELLKAICMNTGCASTEDMDTINTLTKLRLKSKSCLAQFAECMRELLASAKNRSAVLRMIIHNELSSSRAPHNMSLLQLSFQVDASHTARELARVIAELLCTQREDYSRSIRMLLREVVRTCLRGIDLPVTSFIDGLIEYDPPAALLQQDETSRDRTLHSMVEIMSLSLFLAVSAPVKDAVLARNREAQCVVNYQSMVTLVLPRFAEWLFEKAVKRCNPSATELTHSLDHLLFIDPETAYCGRDNWPVEQDRNLCLRLICDAPLDESLLLSLLEVGSGPADWLPRARTVTVLETLLLRNAERGEPSVSLSSDEIIAALLECCVYKAAGRPVEETRESEGHILARTTSLDSARLCLLILASASPSLIGNELWQNYSMMRYLMEMLMTKDFTFPPQSAQSPEEVRAAETKLVESERSAVLALESKLTGQQVTREISELWGQLCVCDARGNTVPRSPSHELVEKLRPCVQTVGAALCRSRDPDFLLQVINSRGGVMPMVEDVEMAQTEGGGEVEAEGGESTSAANATPWLLSLASASSGSGGVASLPVQCIVELMIHSVSRKHATVSTEHAETQAQVQQRLQDVFWTTDANGDQLLQQAVSYLFARLKSETLAGRKLAVSTFKRLLEAAPDFVVLFESHSDSIPDSLTEDFRWLFRILPSLPRFSAIERQLHTALCEALLVETRASYIAAYIHFLSERSQAMQDLRSTAGSYVCSMLRHRAWLHGCLESGLSAGDQVMISTYSKVVRFVEQTIESGVSVDSDGQISSLKIIADGSERPTTSDVINACVVMITLCDYLAEPSEQLLKSLRTISSTLLQPNSVSSALFELLDPCILHYVVQQSSGDLLNRLLQDKISYSVAEGLFLTAAMSENCAQRLLAWFDTFIDETDASIAYETLKAVETPKLQKLIRTTELEMKDRRGKKLLTALQSMLAARFDSLPAETSPVSSAEAEMESETAAELATALMFVINSDEVLNESNCRVVEKASAAQFKSFIETHDVKLADYFMKHRNIESKVLDLFETRLAGMDFSILSEVIRQLKSESTKEEVPIEIKVEPMQVDLVSTDSHMEVALSSDESVSTCSTLRSRLTDALTNPTSPEECVAFVSTLSSLPRMWRGREQRQPRHAAPPTVTRLRADEAIALAQHLIAVYALQSDKLEPTRQGAKYLLHLLYLNKPHIRAHVTKTALLQDAPECNGVPSALDSQLHRLLLQLYHNCSLPEYTDGITETHRTLSYMASNHPQLFARQLPLINSGLRSLPDKPAREMVRTSCLMTYMTCVLDYLDLIADAAFTASFASQLHDVLSSFVAFFDVHARRSTRYMGMIDRMFTLLRRYLRSDPCSAMAWMRLHASSLQAVATRFPNINSARTVMSEVMLPLPALSLAEHDNTGNDSHAPVTLRPPSACSVDDVTPLLDRLRGARTATETAVVLTDIEELCSKKNDATAPFMRDLQKLVVCSDSSQKAACRAKALDLLLKHLAQRPAEARQYVATISMCLSQEDPQLVELTMRHLPDLVSLCRAEFAEDLTARAFDAVMKTATPVNIDAFRKLMCTLNGGAVNIVEYIVK